MNDFQDIQPQLFEAFIKASQYMVRLKTQQDMREHLSKLVTTFFAASWTAFAKRDAKGLITIYNSSLPDSLAARCLSAGDVNKTIADVLDSGFLATQVIAVPTPSMTVFLPVIEEYQTTSVMLIGHQTASPVGSDLLNIYLAIAGLAGETSERLHNELELNRHRTQLEGLVKERTAELTSVKHQNELILNSVGEGICGLDSDGRINFVNPAAAKMIGWKPEGLIGRDGHATFHHSHSDGCAYLVEDCPVRLALKSASAKAVTDENFFRKDGTRFPVEFTVTPIKEGSHELGAVLVFRDISKRKQAEEELKRSNQKINEILDSIQEDFYVLDSTWKFIFASRTFTSKIGKEPADFVGHNIWQMFPKHLGTDYEKNLRDAMEKKEIRRFEIGDKYTNACYEMTVFPSQDQVIILGSDITDRKKAEESLENYANNLETANKELEAFSYSVSHDLKAPLRAMDSFSEILIEDYKDKIDETGRDYLNRIRKASQTMSQLINDMLKLSRIVRTEIQIDMVDLSEMVKNIANELQDTNPGRKVEFVITPGILVKGDQGLLDICLKNLLENAWKFTANNTEAVIEFGAMQRDGQTVYFVKDNGIGFDMTYSDKLFHPFQRLHSGNEYPGTGIGLAIVQRIVRRHHGDIWGESEINKGTTFYFTIGNIAVDPPGN